MGRPIQNLVGIKFNMLTVMELDCVQGGHAMWKCMCDCGNKTIVSPSALKLGTIKSCGCFRKKYMSIKQKTHGMTKTKIYNSWRSMINRCKGYNEQYHKNYVLKHITVCDKWLTFEGFYEDMNDSHKDGLSIDRINNNKSYCKENCRWATMSVQDNNRSTNIFFTVDGITDTLANTARRYGTTGKLAHRRIKTGWNVEKAFKTPPDLKHASH